MKSLRRRFRTRSDNERGATLIIVAISSMLFLGAGALSVDIGLDTVVNRSLQSVADAGALDAARYINVEASVTPALTSAQLTAALTTKALSAATDIWY